MKRHLCCINSLDALKPNGSIILDDSERKNYQKTFDFFAKNNFVVKLIDSSYKNVADKEIKISQTFSKLVTDNICPYFIIIYNILKCDKLG